MAKLEFFIDIFQKISCLKNLILIYFYSSLCFIRLPFIDIEYQKQPVYQVKQNLTYTKPNKNSKKEKMESQNSTETQKKKKKFKNLNRTETKKLILVPSYSINNLFQ